MTSPHGKGVQEQHYFPIQHPSICLSLYLLLNHCEKLTQTFYMSFLGGKGVPEQQYFSDYPFVCLSTMLSPKLRGGIELNLLHVPVFPKW